MTDRELLEMAAKAADLELQQWVESRNTFFLDPYQCHWNPLEDDGDAFRLACQLNMDVVVRDSYACVDLFRDDINCFVENVDGHTITDKYAATRRVIVRAAAHIGRKL